MTGRLDDVINVSGHRLGTAEIEDVVVRGMELDAELSRPHGNRSSSIVSAELRPWNVATKDITGEDFS